MLVRLATLLPLVLLACAGPADDGDGSSSLGPLLPLDEAAVEARVLALDALLPGCAVTGVDAAPTMIAGQGALGDCGGELVVDWDHGDGDTAYTLDFQSFCVSGGGDAVTLDGVVEGVEHGTSSDDGPVIDAIEITIPSVLDVTHPAGAMQVRLERLHGDYGLPAAWQPATPTADAPDVTRVDGLVFSFPGTDHPDLRMEELEVERVGAIPELTIIDGAVVFEDEGHVRIRSTAGAPVTVAGLDGVTGSVEVLGADDAVLQVQIGEVGPLSLSSQLDGEELDIGMDCAGAVAPGAQIYAALIGALPIY